MTMHLAVPIRPSVSSTQLSGPRLWVARIAWAVILLLVGSMFAVSLPHAINDVTFYEGLVLQARGAAAIFFPNYAAFVNYVLFLRLLVVVVYWVTAVYIAWRKPDDWMVLYVSATLLMMSYLFAFRIDTNWWRFPAPLLVAFPAIEWVAPLLFGFSFLLLFYLFPDGRFVPQQLRWLFAAAILVMPLLFYLGDLRLIQPDVGWSLFVALVLATFLIGLTSQAYRWQQAGLIQRQQTRLVVLALGVFALIPFIQIIFSSVFQSDSWAYFFMLHVLLIAAALIPLTIGISVLRHRLWGMSALLNRTLVAGLLTVVVLVIYVLVVGAISFLFQTNVTLPIAALATGIVALLVHPLRMHLQRLVNRLMYGQRDDPLAVIAELGRQLENTAVPGETLPNLVETIAQTLKLPYVAIEMDTAGGERTIAAKVSTNGHQSPTTQSYALAYQGETVGKLLVAPRAAGETFTADEERLLRNIARQAGTAVYAYRLTDQLKRSRERLVTAQEEERRRLRRDLHDGLGPQLATLAVKVDAAQNLLQSDPEAAQQLLAAVRAESQQAIAEIRRVVDGLRPAVMDQFGLLSALQQFVAQNEFTSHITIQIDAPDELPPLPAAVEVAAYRIAAEAITNAIRHAKSRNCTIRLWVAAGGQRRQSADRQPQSILPEQLCIEISDDGAGFPPQYTPGVGLASMRERALELGGTFALESNAGHGATIHVALPIPWPALEQ
jgi:signal transduction histidine kinase